ncbi:MAG: SAP domain-containing protein [Pseudomonadota bacterium]
MTGADTSADATMPKLRLGMSVAEFDDGYHYAADLKAFAREIGLRVGNFRKIELEELIREVLRTGKVPDRRPVLPRKAGAERDALTPDTVVVNYVGDTRTKAFLLGMVRDEVPGLGLKSGQWYWLNDWRRRRQEARDRFTYRELAEHLRGLMLTDGRLQQIPSARMNNFITDFRADPVNDGVPRDAILTAWTWLKSRPGPNTYAEYCRLTPFHSAKGRDPAPVKTG